MVLLTQCSLLNVCDVRWMVYSNEIFRRSRSLGEGFSVGGEVVILLMREVSEVQSRLLCARTDGKYRCQFFSALQAQSLEG